jgi:hypothetical protein
MTANYGYVTSASTTWTSDTVSYQSRPTAHILETKPPGSNWHDVIKITINNDIFKLGDMISLTTNEGGVCKVIEFKPTEVIVGYMDSGQHTTVFYDYIKHLDADAIKGVKLNPNIAFQYKKKGGKY